MIRTSKSTGGMTTTVGQGIHSREHCQDVVGHYGEENVLSLHKVFVRRPYVLNGQGENRSYNYVWNNFAAMPEVTLNGDEHVPSARISIGYLQTEAIARSNPYARPDVDIGNFLWELKEFPSLLRSGGFTLQEAGTRRYYEQFIRFRGRKDTISDIAGQPISYLFGWAPLLSDLRKLVSFADSVQRRYDKFMSIGHEWSTKPLNLFSGSYGDTQTYSSGYMSHRRNRTSSVRAWAVFKHRLKDMPRLRAGGLVWNEAIDAAYRLDLHPATIWNMIPWSWLIDYLVNVSDMLEANNMCSYEVKHMTVMREIRTTAKYACLGPTSTLNVSSYQLKEPFGEYYAHSKERFVSINPSPKLAFKPLITANQLRNLGALTLAFAFKGSGVSVAR